MEYSGIGLFTGEEVKLRFKPSSVNTGINFIRTDIEGNPKIPANVETVSDCKQQISLKKQGVEIKKYRTSNGCTGWTWY